MLCTHRPRAGAWGLLAEGDRKGEKKEGKEGEEVGDPTQEGQTPHLTPSSGPAGGSRDWMQTEGRPDPEANPQIQNSPESSKDREGPLQVSNPGSKLHSLPPSSLSPPRRCYGYLIEGSDFKGGVSAMAPLSPPISL